MYTRLMTFSRRIAIVIQRFAYGTAPPVIPPDEEDILEQALRLEEEQGEEDDDEEEFSQRVRHTN